MARPRINLPPELAAEIKRRTEAGESAKTIHAAVGARLSVKTIERRQNELRGPRVPRPVCKACGRVWRNPDAALAKVATTLAGQSS
jgi:hypothetical protein